MRPSASPVIDHAVLFGFDGLRPDCVNATDCPHLSALLESATVLTRHRSVFPTLTRVNLTSLVTAACPRDHGIVSNVFFVRGNGRNTPLDTSRLEDLNALASTTGGHSVSRLHVQRLLARSADHFAVAATGSNGSLNLLSNFQTDSDLAFNPVVKFSKAATPSGVAWNYPKEAMEHFLLCVWPGYAPKISVLWFAEADAAGHRFGIDSPEHRDALRQIDTELGRLIAWRDSQANADRIAVAVASDHGHVSVGSSISIVDWLNGEGFRADMSFDDEPDIALVSGMSPGLWLRKRDRGLLQAVVNALGEQSWCGPIFAAMDADMAVDGAFAFKDMGLDHPLAPDLILTFGGDNRPNEFGASGMSCSDLTGSDLGLGAGHHGGLHQTELHCLFAIEGAPFAAERRDDLTSCTANIMPTLCAALGLTSDFPAQALPVLGSDVQQQEAVVKNSVRSVCNGVWCHTLHLQSSDRIVHVDRVESRFQETNNGC